MSNIILSAFADEYDPSLAGQLEGLARFSRMECGNENGKALQEVDCRHSVKGEINEDNALFEEARANERENSNQHDNECMDECAV